jgi:hypothetical protein
MCGFPASGSPTGFTARHTDQITYRKWRLRDMSCSFERTKSLGKSKRPSARRVSPARVVQIQRTRPHPNSALPRSSHFGLGGLHGRGDKLSHGSLPAKPLTAIRHFGCFGCRCPLKRFFVRRGIRRESSKFPFSLARAHRHCQKLSEIEGSRESRLSDRSCCAHDVGLARRQSSTNPFLQIRPARALKSALCPANEQLLDQNISLRSDADRMF